MAGTRGSSCDRCGISRNGPSGWAADTTGRVSTRCRSIPAIPTSVLIGVSCGGAWITDDDGSTWSVTHGMRNEYMPPGEEYTPHTQDPHRLARCAAHPDVVWNQHHNGCFRSVDAGRTWTEITDRAPSVFGFAVAAHPTDPDVAWFVPAVKDELRVPVDGRFVVSRTTDGGASFDVFGDGLPDQHAYDLVYRHGLDVDVVRRRAGDGIHDRLAVDQRQRRRALVAGVGEPPAGALRPLRRSLMR